MNHLLRSLAPISESGWKLLDGEARDRLTPALGARKLVDFSGPHGWEHSATNLGRVRPLEQGAGAVSALQRRVLPLIELRAGFSLSRSELRDADRGADDVDLSALDTAAHEIALAEGAAVFHGWGDAISGIATGSTPESADPVDVDTYPDRVAGALQSLLASGIGGPYALALDSERFRHVIAAVERVGYPLREHLEKILDGPVVWVPGLSGATVVSLRGGDFIFDSGQDLAIGYDSHDADHVHLYLQESFSFHVATPEAAVTLGS